MILIYKKIIYISAFSILVILANQSNSFSKYGTVAQRDSLVNEKSDTTVKPAQNTNFNTFKILTNLTDEQKILAEKLYSFQYELGIPKGMELTELEIYVDKTSEDKSKWNVLINDTILQFSPSLGWNYLSAETRELLDNWTGKGEKTNLEFKKVFTVEAKPNEMFRVMVVPLVSMGEDAKLSILQKNFTYDIIIVDDYPEQVEIRPKQGLTIKRLDKNTFRLKLARFNRAAFERWAENRDDDPYVYTTSIVLYDKLSDQKSKPINLKYTFGEY